MTSPSTGTLKGDTNFIKSKLFSRKFWVTVAVGTVVVFGNAFDLDIDEADVYSLVALASAYLGVQGVIDFNGK